MKGPSTRASRAGVVPPVPSTGSVLLTGRGGWCPQPPEAGSPWCRGWGDGMGTGDREERMRQQGQREMAITARPAPDVIVIQAHLPCGGLTALLNGPPTPRRPHRLRQGGAHRPPSHIVGQLGGLTQTSPDQLPPAPGGGDRGDQRLQRPIVEPWPRGRDGRGCPLPHTGPATAPDPLIDPYSQDVRLPRLLQLAPQGWSAAVDFIPRAPCDRHAGRQCRASIRRASWGVVAKGTLSGTLASPRRAPSSAQICGT